MLHDKLKKKSYSFASSPSGGLMMVPHLRQSVDPLLYLFGALRP